jgi:hypothetical protein
MKINSHYFKNTYTNENHFFILSKGKNAGKPMINPLPNCFVFTADNLLEREYYFWLCYGLWVGGFFRPFLSGSVISFLRISQLKQGLHKTQSKIKLRKEALKDSIEILNKISAQQDQLLKRIQRFKQAKKSLMYK